MIDVDPQPVIRGYGWPGGLLEVGNAVHPRVDPHAVVVDGDRHRAMVESIRHEHSNPLVTHRTRPYP